MYSKTGDWGWEFYPPPYDFLAPRNSAAMPAPVIGRGVSGLGCGGKCGGSCCGGGDHAHGMGLFESGLDYTQWGVAEWGAVIVGGYLVMSLVGDAFSTKRAVGQYTAKRRKRASIRAKYERELAAA